MPTFHIADPDCLVSADEIRHRPIGAPSTAAVPEQVDQRTGCRPGRSVGLTAGASTPNNIVGQVIERLEALVEQPVRPGLGPVKATRAELRAVKQL